MLETVDNGAIEMLWSVGSLDGTMLLRGPRDLPFVVTVINGHFGDNIQAPKEVENHLECECGSMACHGHGVKRVDYNMWLIASRSVTLA